MVEQPVAAFGQALAQAGAMTCAVMPRTFVLFGHAGDPPFPGG
ncbi:hypothetical protein ACFSUK_06800 [Sphingobium scionense]